MGVRAIPEGYHTVTPCLVVEGAARLIDFLKQAFGAKEVHPPTLGPDGSVMHAEMKIGDSMIMMGEARGEHRPMPSALYLYVEDTDALYHRALKAGAASILEPVDQFYGDRNAGVKDPSGNQWWIATHKEDVSPEEIERRMKAMPKKQG